MDGHAITMLGTGLIGDFYTNTLHGQRGRDRVRVVYSRSAERGEAFRERWGDPRDRRPTWPAAIEHPDTDVVVVGAAQLPPRGGGRAGGEGRQGGPVHQAARPDGRRGAPDARGRSSRPASSAATSRTCATRPRRSRRSPRSRAGAIGDVTWVRSRETHPGPHSAWFWDGRLTGGGAIIDLGCHCIEIIRNFVGKGNRPVEVLCHTDTLVHPIADEDNAVALIRFESGAIGQFEVSWTFRGGMDLRDEVAGTHGTIWMNHFLRTGFEMFTRRAAAAATWPRRRRSSAGLAVPGRRRGVRARLRGHVQRHVPGDRRGPRAAGDVLRRLRRQRDHGRRLPVGEGARLGAGRARLARRRRRRGSRPTPETYEGQVVIKREILPDGRHKLILKDPASGDFTDRVVAGG